MSSDPLQIVGKTLAGHFRVEHLVGEGGHSLVYRGTHIGPGVPVALKCLKVDLSLSAGAAETFLKNFREENKAAARFARGDAGFARSIGSGMTTAGPGYVLYLVLEWLDGRPLRDDLVERRRGGGRGRSFDEAGRILLPIASAIARAHEAGLVHGDVCPGNALISPTGDVRILDLGVSLHLEQLSKGLRSYSHVYAAPDRLKGAAPTPAQDVYSLGAMLFELLTDRPPLEASSYEEAAKVANDELARPTAARVLVPLTAPQKDLLSRALSKRPEERPATAQAFVALLAPLVARQSSLPPRPSAPLEPTPSPAHARGPSSGGVAVSLPAPPSPQGAHAPLASPPRQSAKVGTPTSGVMRAAPRMPLPEDATPTSEIATKPAQPLPPTNGMPSPSGPQVVAHPSLPSSARIKAVPRSLEGGHAVSAVTVPKAVSNVLLQDLPSVIVADQDGDAEHDERTRKTAMFDRPPSLGEIDQAGSTSPRIVAPKAKTGKVALLTFLAVLALGGLAIGLYATGLLDTLLRGHR